MAPPLAPAAPLVTFSPTWQGLGLGGSSSFFGPAAQIARDPGAPGATHYTVIPLPVLPPGEITLQRRADAFAATYAGRMEDAVDLYRMTVEADGWMVGLLLTMAHGILQAPLTWQGSDPAILSALTNADGTPGDFARMHPESECAKIITDGIGIGLGLGQYVRMCWNCDGIEMTVATGKSAAHVSGPICKTCKSAQIDRPVGQRVLYQLCWRDPRWLWRNTVTNQWRYTGRQGQVDVNPGDGEWLIFRTVPDTDVWRHGPWTWGTVAAIFSRDSTFDRQATSAVCAPTPVFEAKSATAQATRKDVEAQADNLRFQNKVVLPGEWAFRIEAAKAEFIDVTDSIVDWASRMWAVGITGNVAAIKPPTGFANLDFYAAVERTRRAFLAGAWMRQLCAQGLRWYVADNFGATAATPVGFLDTRSPADTLAASQADEQEGKALKSLHDGWDAVGYELDPAYLEERAQRSGVRVRSQNRGPRVLTWDAKTLASFVTMEQAIADQGLPALPPGDPRAQMMVSAGFSPGGDKTPSGATAAPPQVPPAPGAAPHAAPGAPPSPPAAARLDEEAADDDCDADEDARRASLAASLDGFAACAHGRTHTCPRCGVQRVYGAPTRAPDGSAVHPVAWRAVPTGRPSPAPVAAT